MGGIIMTIKNLKVYLNGKRLRKKIVIDNGSWSFVRPLKLSKEDNLTWEWEIDSNKKERQ